MRDRVRDSCSIFLKWTQESDFAENRCTGVILCVLEHVIGGIIFLDHSNDGVFAEIGRLVIGAVKRVPVNDLLLELTSVRVKG